MRTVVFVDLDDSLFQTPAKCPDGEPLSPAANGRDGKPLSFMTSRQATLLRHLFQAGHVIPVTARSLDAYRRVDLPFSGPAVVGFGAIILGPDGTPDEDWASRMRPACEAAGEVLERCLAAAQRVISDRGLGARARLISDLGMPLYLCVKHPDGCEEALDVVQREAWSPLPGGCFLHRNGNNLSLVPRHLGKERAVQHLLERYRREGPVLALGLGDSLTDAGFLGLCDYALVPRGSQLALLLREGQP
jgi:hypothetical protein